MLELLLAMLLAPSPAASDAMAEAWIMSPAEVPNDLPIALGPALDRFQRRHELWNWGPTNYPWTSGRVRSEIEWTRARLQYLSLPPLADIEKLPSSAEIKLSDDMLIGCQNWLCQLRDVASPMSEEGIGRIETRIAWQRSLLDKMRFCRLTGMSNLCNVRETLDEIRVLVGDRVYFGGAPWPIYPE